MWNWANQIASDRWRYSQVEISEEEPFQIIIEALKLSENDVGSLSIDDLLLSPNACPTLGSCDFMTDSCSYNNVPMDGILWLVGNGKTHNPNKTVGPEESADSSGMYAYMDFTKESLSNGAFGRMISPQLGPTIQSCFSLWFNIFGHRPGSLKVQKVPLLNKL